jgi:hypothetical protein
MKKPPKQVIDLMASRAHRIHHYVWHQVRNAWHRYPDDVKDAITRLGWNPPRPAFYEGDVLALDNKSGEDFLYMHRQMIAQVNGVLQRVGDPNYAQVEGWKSLPKPSDREFEVPNAWDSGDPVFDERFQRVKSAEFFDVMFNWEVYYRSPDNLRRLSLGQLGSLIEFTIHNNSHVRWCARPPGQRPNPDPADPDAIAKEWDDPSYDFLGDTYSSHVNPAFWYLHGWVDECIDHWQRARGLAKIDWTGMWVGKLPQVANLRANNFIVLMRHHPTHDQPQHDHHLHELVAVAKLIGKCGIFTEFYTQWMMP